MTLWLPGPVKDGRPVGRRDPKRTEDLDVRRWFPMGSSKTKIVEVPRILPAHPLRNEYTVIIAKNTSSAVMNDCMHTLTGMTFPGNIIVVRQGARNSENATHFASNERTLVDLVVFRYVRAFEGDLSLTSAKDGLKGSLRPFLMAAPGRIWARTMGPLSQSPDLGLGVSVMLRISRSVYSALPFRASNTQAVKRCHLIVCSPAYPIIELDPNLFFTQTCSYDF